MHPLPPHLSATLIRQRRMNCPCGAHSGRPNALCRKCRHTALRRLLVALVLLVIVVAIVVATILLSHTAAQRFHYRKITGRDVQSAINQLEGLVNRYTK